MSRLVRHPAIRSYNLFGESGDLPDVIHCETIAARSVLHDWEFAAHRHPRLHQILLIEAGGGHAQLEERTLDMKPAMLINVPAGSVHAFSFLPRTEGYVLTFASEMLDEIFLRSEGLNRVIVQPRMFKAKAEIRNIVKAIFREHGDHHFGRAQMLRSLSGALLALVARELADQAREAHPLHRAPQFRAFETLLEQHFADHWSVARYAKALGMTPTHLTRIAQASAGMSASRLIQARVLREARRNLVYTNLDIATIAFALGYDDPAYFSRVFKTAIGLPPRQFRAQFQTERTKRL